MPGIVRNSVLSEGRLIGNDIKPAMTVASYAINSAQFDNFILVAFWMKHLLENYINKKGMTVELLDLRILFPSQVNQIL